MCSSGFRDHVVQTSVRCAPGRQALGPAALNLADECGWTGGLQVGGWGDVHGLLPAETPSCTDPFWPLTLPQLTLAAVPALPPPPGRGRLGLPGSPVICIRHSIFSEVSVCLLNVG